MSNIAKNDMYISNLKELIENRKKIFFDKFKEINKNSSENERLQDILIDNYYEYEKIIEEKNKLIDAFNHIVIYLDTIIEDNTIDKIKREEAYREKKNIMELIKSQKKEIKSISL